MSSTRGGTITIPFLGILLFPSQFLGILLGVPIPAVEEGNSSIDDAIQTAVREAAEKNIVGKEITPYILAR